MSYPARFLRDTNSSPTAPATISPETATVDSDFIIILAALLCALICLLGLLAVVRCACLRRLSTSFPPPPPPANKGLKKKVLRSLPKLTYFAEHHGGKLVECAICLSEFTAGDEIRILPQCGHGFHVVCIDTWLGSHSSCPSCRQILAAARCHKCGGGLPEISLAEAAEGRGTEERHVSSFLP